MSKAVIFDLNGIFIEGRKLSQRFQEDFGISENIFLPALSKIMDLVRRPNAGPAFNYWKPVLAEWKINLNETQFWDYWFKAEHSVPEMLKYAQILKKKNVKLFLLSNNFKERAEYYGHYPWLSDLFVKVYFSWQTGFVKPDERAWKLVLEENELKPAECLYFDDQEKNTKAAESVGIKAYLKNKRSEIEPIVEEFIK